MHEAGRPLVGTTSVEKSEYLSKLLNQREIPYNLLNAKPENVGGSESLLRQDGKVR